jgi:hypothetical protein
LLVSYPAARGDFVELVGYAALAPEKSEALAEESTDGASIFSALEFN